MDQEQLIEKMGAQLKENEDFKAALAEQEMKRKMREITGMAESMRDDQSQSRSSFTDDQSRFTALRSKRTETQIDMSQMSIGGGGRSMIGLANQMMASQKTLGGTMVKRNVVPQLSLNRDQDDEASQIGANRDKSMVSMG